MPTTPRAHQLAIIGCSAAGRPRTFRLEPLPRPAASRNAAYRRLAAAILSLDVPTLARDLRAARLTQSVSPVRAA
jgi:hypothetical protein